MKEYYIVSVYNMDTQRAHHHGMIWADKEKAKEYRDYCNKQFDIMNMNKIAHIETLRVVDE